MATVTQSPAATAARIAALEHDLSQLAYRWRGAADAQQAAALVQQYHAVAETMRQLGWDGRWLAPDAMLPNELMPRFLQAG